MDLSLIIPCHNLEEYIQPLLNSLLIQKTKYQVEYIFVLDDCSDRTQDIIEKSGLTNYSIMTCNVNSCGLARNIGLEQAIGEYIWFVDGDDWLLETNTFDLILDTMKELKAYRLQLLFKSDTFKLDSTVMVWRHVFLKQFLDGIRFVRIPHSEDVLFMRAVEGKEIRLLGNPKIYQLNIPVYYYNYGRPGSNMMKVTAGETPADVGITY